MTEKNEMQVQVEEIAEGVKSFKENAASETEALKSEVAELKTAIARMDVAGGDDEDEGDAEQKAAFGAFLRKSRLNDVEEKAMSTLSNPDGGYAVPEEMANFIATRVFETSPMRQVANVVSMSSKTLDVRLDDDEAAAGWVAEAGTVSETNTPELGEISITAHKVYADPKISEELIQDADFDVEGWLQGKVSNKFSRTENTAFVNGTGVGQPTGFLTYPAWASAGTYERDALEQINSGDANLLTADGLIDLQNALIEDYQANAVFMMKRNTWGAVKKLKDSSGRYLFGETILANGEIRTETP